jgi:hypothetical protein
MKKTFAAFVAVATIVGSLAATPASAQRRRRGSGLLSRTTSRALRRFWQLRMGDTAFLGRLWLAGPPGASLRLIRDYETGITAAMSPGTFEIGARSKRRE